jgi:outer membrane receptor protein involved in Fe transport
MISADSVEHLGFCTLITLVCSLKNIRVRLLSRIIFCLIACFFCPSCWAQGHAITGSVRDTSGAAVTGAEVTLKTDRTQRSTRANEECQFAFPAVAENTGTITVHASGFLPELRTINFAREETEQLQLVLRPSVASEQVIVSASRTPIRLPETPGSSILISQSTLDVTPALRVDDALRQVPGFSLLRRSTSRTANPTTQGVSLRGVGGSGASRALVLADAIPLADPFGGWVYWNRVPKAAIESIEVMRGGGSNLYGSSALGGVVQLITRNPETPTLSLEASYGNERSAELSLWAGNRWRRWDYSVATELFHTDGFVLVPSSDRGSVDTAANSQDASVYATIGHSLGSRGRIFGRGNFFTESRNNGTHLQTNDTRIAEGMLGFDTQFGADSLMLRAFGDAGAYNQAFSSLAPDRNSETLVDLQHVPDQVIGVTAQWVHNLNSTNTLLLGSDFTQVLGSSNEALFSGPNQARDSGGRQRRIGWFGEDIFHYGRWNVILGARADHWKNYRGSILTVPTSGGPVLTQYPARSDLALSPRLSILRSLGDRLAATGSIYRAFRAPTLNELYRTFRVGNISTLNNPSLAAERLTGVEAGMRLSLFAQRLNVRGTFFWSDIVDPITNVTLSSTPALITRQRQNLGRTRSRGLELDGGLRLNSTLQAYAGYAFTQATVLQYPGAPGGVDLVGRDVPQVPRNVFTWGLFYSGFPRWSVSVSGRFVGEQFDDDQNQFVLHRFYTSDFQIGRTIRPNLEVFLAAENFFNQRYETARTPTVNLGPPALFRLGVRLNFPPRAQTVRMAP